MTLQLSTTFVDHLKIVGNSTLSGIQNVHKESPKRTSWGFQDVFSHQNYFWPITLLSDKTPFPHSVSLNCWPLISSCTKRVHRRKSREPCTHHATNFSIELHSSCSWSIRSVIYSTLLKEPVLKIFVMEPWHDLRDDDIMEFGTHP